MSIGIVRAGVGVLLRQSIQPGHALVPDDARVRVVLQHDQVNVFHLNVRGRFDGKRGELDRQYDDEQQRANAEQKGHGLHDTEPPSTERGGAGGEANGGGVLFDRYWNWSTKRGGGQGAGSAW